MKWGKMDGRMHTRPLLTLTLTVILVFGIGYNLTQNGIADPQSTDEHTGIGGDTSDQIPQTREELEQLMSNLGDISPEKEAEIKENLKIPFSGFLKNEGQNPNEDIRFYYSSKDSFIGFGVSTIFFSQAVYDDGEFVENILFDIKFPASNVVKPTGLYQMSHSTNYFMANLEFSNILSTKEVWFYDLYPNIDLRYYMSEQGLKYDFIVHPGGNPDTIQIKVSDEVELEVYISKVAIISDTHAKNMILVDNQLKVFQENGKQIEARFKAINERSYGIYVKNFDKDTKLTIDPIWLGFSTYLGGSNIDTGYAVAVDSTGNTYITGETLSADFPIFNEYNTNQNVNDVFVTVLNVTGNGLLYSTYLSGNSDDSGYGIAVDESHNAYITGYTLSTNFPMTDTLGGGGLGIKDIFVTKLNATGNGLNYSTILGGNGDDVAYAITIDSFGNVFITGYTDSTIFNTNYPFQTNQGGRDAFVTKLNAAGNALIYSTFLGGESIDVGYGIAVDSASNAYITGSTDSTSFPLKNAYQMDQGSTDAFVTKLNSTGNGSIYSTYLGGESIDVGYGIAVDSASNAYITGSTDSTSFPLKNAYQIDQGGTDAFVTKLNFTGNGLNYSTYLGGSDNDVSHSIALNGAGIAYIAGETTSNDFPTINEYQSDQPGIDAFVSKLNYMGNQLIYSTYIGGVSDDVAYAIAVDTTGNSYITGETSSNDFPTIDAYQNEQKGIDAFLFKISSEKFSTYIGGISDDIAYAITIDNFGSIYITGSTRSSNFPTLNEYQTDQLEDDVFVLKLNITNNELIYNTYLGGDGHDYGHAIAIDQSGNAYITGFTESTDFPTKNEYQSDHPDDSEGVQDVFITKLNSTGNGLSYSTYLGGIKDDIGYGIAVDSSGFAYVTGFTQSFDFPTLNPYQMDQGGMDVFVTKLNGAGNGLIYSTYLGGDSIEIGYAITVDSAGNAYISGETDSTDFPTKNQFQIDSGDFATDAFVTKLNVTGNGLVYSTYLGGDNSDTSYGISVDRDGNSHIIGSTLSNNFPTKNEYQTYQGNTDAFVTKLNGTGNGVVYSTYLGGSSWDEAYGIALDNSGNAYITGSTLSNNFPTKNAYQNYQGNKDVFVTKLNGTGNGIVNSTYLGGIGADTGYGIAVDSDSKIYITGETSSGNFPTISAYQTHQGATDVFIFKFGLEYDNDFPQIQLISHVNNSILSLETQIEFHVSDTIYLDQVLYHWDGNDNQTWNGLFQTIIPTNDGPHTLNVYAKDAANNWNKKVFTFTTDSTAPSILLQTAKLGDIFTSGTFIDLLISDINLKSAYYNWDANTNQTWSVDNQPHLPINDGFHTLYVFASDIAGNWNSSISQFTTDDTDPEVTLTDLIAGTVLKSNSEIQLNITENHIHTVLYNWDGISNITLYDPYSVQQPNNDILHTLNVYIQDTAGNWKQAVFTFITDDTPPSINFTDPNQSEILQSQVIVEFRIEDLHNVSTVMYKWDEGLSYETFNDVSDIATPLGDGNHLLYILARDDLGNEIEVSFHFTIDNTIPNLLITGIEQLTTLKQNATIDVIVSDLNGIVKVEFYLDDDLVSTQTGPEFSLIINPGNLENKQYDLQVWAYDPAGNIVKSEIIKFTVNNESPSEDSSIIPQEALLGIVVASVLAISTATFRLRQRRRMDKAFDQLESDFEGSEITGEGKNE